MTQTDINRIIASIRADAASQVWTEQAKRDNWAANDTDGRGDEEDDE